MYPGYSQFSDSSSYTSSGFQSRSPPQRGSSSRQGPPTESPSPVVTRWLSNFPPYPSLGEAASNVQSGYNSRSPQGPGHYKAASAPGPSNAFPPSPDMRKADNGTQGNAKLAMSPAARFLSAFSSPVSSTPQLPDAEGSTVEGYVLGPVIGHGGFSVIRRASSSAGALVAVKIVRHADLLQQDDPEEARNQLSNEAATWSSLSHEHIMPLFSFQSTPYADYFVTLFCPAGSLFDILKRDGRPALPHDDAGTMFRQIVRGLRYMHEMAGLVHGDVKLENVLVDEMGMCRITDFGLTRRIGEGEETCDEDDERVDHVDVLKQSKRHQKPGLSSHLSLLRRQGHHNPRHRKSTPFPAEHERPPSHPFHHFQPGSLPYAAPELLTPMHSARGANPAQDIWALGVLLYALLTGRLPFIDSFEPRLQMKILHGVYDQPPGIGQGAESVLKGCLEKSAERRWTIDMVDDVAWGVGWGNEASIPSSNDDLDPVPYRRSGRSQSRTGRQRPYPPNLHTTSPSQRYPSQSSSSRSRSRSGQRSRSKSGQGSAGSCSGYERGRVSSTHGSNGSHSRSSSPNSAFGPPRTPTDTVPADFSVQVRGRRPSLPHQANNVTYSVASDLDVLHESSKWSAPARRYKHT